jgi:uncharacterized membrane protein YfcA
VRLDGALTARLVLIGLAAGVFSAVFGVGGGIILVPLLIGLTAFPIREATATSLGAILVTASAGVVLYAARGDVRVGYAALVGLPAVAGAVLGTHVQQRVSGPRLTLGFAALLLVVGIWLIVA